MGQVIRRLRNEIADVLQLLGTAGPDADGLARLGVVELPRFVPSDLTTLSVCDLATGHRRVFGNPGETLSPDDIAAFDRHFFAHPLVRFHRAHPDGGTHRISDSVARRNFRESALYNEYYRRIAAIVGLSPRTVQKHLQHIYVKLGVENRTAAAMRARTIP